MSLTVRRWSLDEWQSQGAAWDELLAGSANDRLFLSSDWLTTWWKWFGARRGELQLLAVYRGGELVGAAPLYLRRVVRRMLPVRSLQFVGTAWHDPDALISEYLDFVALRGLEPQVRECLLEHLLESGGWSELLIGYARDSGGWLQTLSRTARASGTYGRATEHCVSHQADLAGGFPAYLQRLGQSTRRSLWHLRRRLGDPANVRFEHVGVDELDAAFEEFNELHARRWGASAFTAERLSFHRELTRTLGPRGEVAFSRLRIGGRTVSMLYDLRKAGRQYNLKLAFDPTVERGYSLGLIHLGFAIERAANDGITMYDFLAGPGRLTDFKWHLSQQRESLATLQLLRGQIVRRLYRLHDLRLRRADARQG
jgi:CelD/BcsL family acetyltransferase involved in cellulose biosynthesis